MMTLLVMWNSVPLASCVPDIYRLHWGTTFSHMGRLLTYEQTWYHTFAIELPKISNYPTLPRDICKNASLLRNRSSCDENMRAVLNFTYRIHDDTLNDLVEGVTLIKNIIPQGPIPGSQTRSKRALLPFIGEFSHNLFGTARDSDVNIIRQHINILSHRMRAEEAAFNMSQDYMGSYMSKANDRMDGLKQGIIANHNELTELINVEDGKIRWFQAMYAHWIQLIAKELHFATMVERKINRLSTGLYKLLENVLSPELIPFRHLRRALSKIRRALKDKYPNFHLAHKDLPYYYTATKVHYVRHDSTVYVTMMLPVTSKDRETQLYQVKLFPVPLNHTSGDATVVGETIPYIAISTVDETFLEFTSDQYELCTQNQMLIKCHNLPAQRSFQNPSCNLALFFNDIDLVHEVCEIGLVPNGAGHFMFELNSGDLLLSGISKIVYSCEDKTKTMKGCSLCVIPLLCNCRVDGDGMTIPPRLTGCHEATTKTNFKYPLNVGLLRHYFSADDLRAEVENFLTDEPASYDIPEFQVANHTFSKIMGDDKKIRISLRRAVKLAKQNKIIYTHPTDPIFMNNWTPVGGTQWLSGTSYMLYGCFFGLILLTVYMGILSRRLSVLILACHLEKASASVLNRNSDRRFRWLPPTPSPTKASTDNNLANIKAMFDINILFYAGVLVIFAIAVYIIMKRMRNSKTYLEIELASRTKCTHVTLATIPVSPLYIRSLGTNMIPQSISITRRLVKFDMILSWGSNKPSLVNTITNERIELPRKVSLSWVKAGRLTRMMDEEYIASVSLIHGNVQYPIVVNESGRPSAPLPCTTATQTAAVSDVRLIYPSVPQRPENIEMSQF
ncbi:uncharacterized protein LOC125372568 [Haliotis rufescens]|uniref:uncharacterized protein LOC125372568 n=1 Tax=Haliotis rufescens TaxID=6454 RepID=UPI00201EFF7E|nr:uncharacterized protein LOC125372568 [Haliotis rufescens]